MGLDIRVKERKEIRCPDCGKVVGYRDLNCTASAGSDWYEILGEIGYYVPYEHRTKENDWYGKDMVLDDEQARRLAAYAVEKRVYNYDEVENAAAITLLHGNRVVVNADW